MNKALRALVEVANTRLLVADDSLGRAEPYQEWARGTRTSRGRVAGDPPPQLQRGYLIELYLKRSERPQRSESAIIVERAAAHRHR